MSTSNEVVPNTVTAFTETPDGSDWYIYAHHERPIQVGRVKEGRPDADGCWFRVGVFDFELQLPEGGLWFGPVPRTILAPFTKDEVDAMDEDELVRGYLDGRKLRFDPTCHEVAYWHGLMNGVVDVGQAQASGGQMALVRAMKDRSISDQYARTPTRLIFSPSLIKTPNIESYIMDDNDEVMFFCKARINLTEEQIAKILRGVEDQLRYGGRL